MTVQELIERLGEFPMTREVVLYKARDKYAVPFPEEQQLTLDGWPMVVVVIGDE